MKRFSLLGRRCLYTLTSRDGKIIRLHDIVSVFPSAYTTFYHYLSLPENRRLPVLRR